MNKPNPFSQLEQYIRSQKNTSNNQRPTNHLQRSKISEKRDVIRRETEVRPEKQIENIMELRNIRKNSDISTINQEKIPEKRQEERRLRKSSPLLNQNTRARNPILQNEPIPSTPNEIYKNREFNSRKKRSMTPSKSQKIYDFVGEDNQEDKQLNRIVHRKETLIQNYHDHSDFWNRDTKSLYDNLINQIPETRKKSVIAEKKEDLYEDPKLTRMKNIMNYHKEKLSRKESNSVLKGISNYSQSDRNIIENGALSFRTSANPRNGNEKMTNPSQTREINSKNISEDKKSRFRQNSSNIFFIEEQEEKSLNVVQTIQPSIKISDEKQKRQSNNASNIFFIEEQKKDDVLDNKSIDRKTSGNNIFPLNDDLSNRSNTRKVSPLKYKYDISSQIDFLAKGKMEIEEIEPSDVIRKDKSQGKKHFGQDNINLRNSLIEDYQKSKEQTRFDDLKEGHIQNARESLLNEYKRKIGQTPWKI